MTDKALLVGINAYPDARLYGCINDVVDMAGLLHNDYGFSAQSIRLLTDRRATTARIVDRLRWLVTGAKAGDRLLFHFSGHGTQVADRNGDEIDRMDEVICPFEFDWSDSHLINDDLLYDIFKSVPKGVAFAWISDSCHSGSLTRDFFEPRVEHSRSRYMPQPADLAWRIHAAKNSSNVKMKVIAPAILNVQFVSGCKDSQTSADADFNGRPNGALTYFLLRALRANKNLPFSDVVLATQTALSLAQHTQVPQADGALVSSPFLTV